MARAILWVHTAGRTGSSAPMGCVRFRISAGKFAIAYRAGGVEPRPYGSVGNVVEACDSVQSKPLAR